MTEMDDDVALLVDLLSYALTYPVARQYAEELICMLGSIRAVFEADAEDLVRMSGIPLRAAQLLTVIPPLTAMCQRETFGENPVLDSPARACEFARTLFYGAHYERFVLICLDGEFGLISYEVLQKGSVSETPFYPRLILETAIRAGCEYAIFAHNHPGGNKSFSVPDLSATRRSISLLGNIGIALLDHIVIVMDDAVSMRMNRYIPERMWIDAAGCPAAAERWAEA